MKVCAIAYDKNGNKHDEIYTWETAQTMANEGYRIVAVADDGFMSMPEIQLLCDGEFEASIDCFGEDHAK